MAEGEGSKEPADAKDKTEPLPTNGSPSGKLMAPSKGEKEDDEDSDDDDEEEDEEEEEPELKYATVTKRIGPVFRNGDAISSILVSGDKMVTLQRASCPTR